VLTRDDHVADHRCEHERPPREGDSGARGEACHEDLCKVERAHIGQAHGHERRREEDREGGVIERPQRRAVFEVRRQGAVESEAVERFVRIHGSIGIGAGQQQLGGAVDVGDRVGLVRRARDERDADQRVRRECGAEGDGMAGEARRTDRRDEQPDGCRDGRDVVGSDTARGHHQMPIDERRQERQGQRHGAEPDAPRRGVVPRPGEHRPQDARHIRR